MAQAALFGPAPVIHCIDVVYAKAQAMSSVLIHALVGWGGLVWPSDGHQPATTGKVTATAQATAIALAIAPTAG